MASWLTHMRVAEQIKQKISEIDFPYFLMGSVSPDSGMPDESIRNYTPSKEVTHYRRSTEGSNVSMDAAAFYDNYLMPEKIMTRSDSTRSFLWGYYFHLITDNLWLEECFRPFKKDYETAEDGNKKDFVDLIREEMFSIDFKFISEKGTELIDQLKSFDGNTNFFYDFDSDYIYECKNRIVEFYCGEPLQLDREYEYLKPELIEEFVAKASEKCLSILVV